MGGSNLPTDGSKHDKVVQQRVGKVSSNGSKMDKGLNHSDLRNIPTTTTHGSIRTATHILVEKWDNRL